VLAARLVYMVWISFHSYDAFLQRQSPPSSAQYSRLANGDNATYRTILVRTLVVSLSVTALSCLVGLPTAHAIARLLRGAARSAALLLLLVPFLVGETVRAFSWLNLLGTDGALPWAAAGPRPAPAACSAATPRSARGCRSCRSRSPRSC
jgi:ABC-type spermidine/putrescine transport system permease subunit I